MKGNQYKAGTTNEETMHLTDAMIRNQKPAVSKETGRAYRPRAGFVVCRSVPTKSAGGVALPDAAAESRVIVVAAVGPDVADMKVGDRVMVASGGGGAYAKLMDERDLYVTAQENVLLVWEEAAP